MKYTVPIWHKITLSVDEAIAYSGIGSNTLRALLREPGCPFALRNGSHTRVKRKELEEYISKNIYLN